MARKRASRSSNDPLGLTATGEALRLHYRDIDWQNIDVSFDKWQLACDSVYQPILLSEDAGLISHEEKIRRIWERDRWLGESASSLGVLVMVLQKEGVNEAFMLELWRQSGLTDEEIKKELAGRPELPDWARGQDLKTAVEECMTALREPTTNPSSQDIAALGSCCLDAILRELHRLGILGICKYCGRTLFPTAPRKEVCSLEYEGRNCSGRRRAKRSYERAQGRTR